MGCFVFPFNVVLSSCKYAVAKTSQCSTPFIAVAQHKAPRTRLIACVPSASPSTPSGDQNDENAFLASQAQTPAPAQQQQQQSDPNPDLQRDSNQDQTQTPGVSPRLLSLSTQQTREPIRSQFVQLMTLEKILSSAIALQEFSTAAKTRDEIFQLKKKQPLLMLREKLNELIENERFAAAAKVRDEIAELVESESHQRAIDQCRNGIIIGMTRDSKEVKLLDIDMELLDSRRPLGIYDDEKENDLVVTEVEIYKADAEKGNVLIPMSVSPSGFYIAVAEFDVPQGICTLYVRSLVDNSLVQSLKLPSTPFFFLWGRNGRFLSFLSADSKKNIIELNGYEVISRSDNNLTALGVFKIGQGIPFYYDFNPDSSRVVMHMGNTKELTVASLNAANKQMRTLVITNACGDFLAPQWIQPSQYSIHTEHTDGILYAIRDTKDKQEPAKTAIKVDSSAASISIDSLERRELTPDRAENEENGEENEDIILMLSRTRDGSIWEPTPLFKVKGRAAFSVNQHGVLALLVIKDNGTNELSLDFDSIPCALADKSSLKNRASTASVILTQPFKDILAFLWSPDGDKLLFLSTGSNDLSTICTWSTYNIKTQQITRYDNFIPSAFFISSYLPFFDQYIRGMTLWSPDSRFFVYSGASLSAPKQTYTWVQEVPTTKSERPNYHRKPWKVGELELPFWCH